MRPFEREKPKSAIRASPLERTAIPRGLRGNGLSAPAPLPLEYFTRLFLEYTVLLKPFFLAPPHAGPWGRRTYWAAPTAADPEKRSAADDDRERPAQVQHITLRRTLKFRRFMSATPQTSSKTILRPENASADLRQGARGTSRRRKSIPGEPPERPGAPSKHPSGTRGRPGEPPRPDHANRSRVSTSSTAPPGAPGTVRPTQPPPFKD